MKKLMILLCVCFSFYSITFADTETVLGTLNKHNQSAIKNMVSLEAERINNEVALSLSIKDSEKYNKIVIERSMTEIENYREIQSLSANELTANNGNFVGMDDSPLPSQMTAFYRIKTIMLFQKNNFHLLNKFFIGFHYPDSCVK